MRQRIGKARAVHVHREAVAARRLGERRDLVDGVDGAELGGLGERQGARLDVVHAAALAPPARRPTSGVSLASGVSAVTILAPPENSAGAPASSSSMWLSAWAMTA